MRIRLSVQLAEVQDVIDMLFVELRRQRVAGERAEIYKHRLQLVTELDRLPARRQSPVSCSM